MAKKKKKTPSKPKPMVPKAGYTKTRGRRYEEGGNLKKCGGKLK